MRQVPHYLLIGDGRVAHHFQHYFQLLGLSFVAWDRRQSLDLLHEFLQTASHVLVLISDQAIEPFISTHLKETNGYLIHFSGSLVSEYAYGIHPLMTFNSNLYELEQYQNIPFLLDHDAPSFEILLPGLPNQSASLNKSLKGKYHALCVLSANFSCLLWQKLFSDFEKEFSLPASIAVPYLRQQTQNLISDYQSALTGPLVRNDTSTLEKNLHALDNDPFQSIYQNFVLCYQQLKEKK